MTLLNDKIKWYFAGVNPRSWVGVIDLGKHFMVNCIRVEKSNKLYSKYGIAVSHDQQCWIHFAPRTESFNVCTVVRFIRIYLVRKKEDIAFIKVMYNKHT